MKILTNLNFNKNQIENVRLQMLGTPPASPVQGQIYYNTTDKMPYYYDGVVWIQMNGLNAEMTGDDILNAIDQSERKIDQDKLNLALKITDIANLESELNSKETPSGAQSKATAALNSAKEYVDDEVGSGITSAVASAKTYTDTKSKSTLSSAKDYADVKAGSATTTASTDATAKADQALADAKAYADKKNNLTLSSSKEYTDTEISKSEISLKDYADSSADVAKSQAISQANTAASNAENAAKAHATQLVTDLVGTAPEILDTFEEIAEALGNDPNFANSITAALTRKTEKYTATLTNKISQEINHNLGTRDVMVTIRETGSPYEIVYTDVSVVADNRVKVEFAQAPANGQYTIIIVG